MYTTLKKVEIRNCLFEKKVQNQHRYDFAAVDSMKLEMTAFNL